MEMGRSSLERRIQMISRNLLRQARRLSGVAAVIGLLLLPLSAAADIGSTTAGAVFLRKIPSAILNDQTNSMSVGADSAGGMHAAFANLSTDTNGNFNAYYDYCAPGLDCANTSNWTVVNLLSVAASATTMDAAQLDLDAQGHPRLVIVTSDFGAGSMDHFNYAACNSNCTIHASWTITEVANLAIGNNANIFNGNKHFFALDPQGRPRFIVDNGVNYEYHFCNTASTSANSWVTAPMVDSFVSVLAASYSSLRLTHSGEPRFAYYGTPGGSAESLYYFWCHSACTNSANWTISDVGLVPAANFNTSGQQPDLA